MTTNRTVGDKEIIMGTVVARYLPGIKMSKSGNEYLASGKLVLESEDGVYEVSFMQLYVDNVRTEEMGALWTSLDLDAIQGKQVAIACTFESDYINSTTGAVKHQFKNPTFIKYLNPGDAPPQIPAVVGTATAPMAPPTALQSVMPMTFEEKKRHDIAWLGAINLAVPLVRPPVEALPEEIGSEARQVILDKWTMRYEELAWPIYLSKLKEPVKPVVKPMELTPEQELFPQQELFQEASDLGSGPGLTGEV